MIVGAGITPRLAQHDTAKYASLHAINTTNCVIATYHRSENADRMEGIEQHAM